MISMLSQEVKSVQDGGAARVAGICEFVKAQGGQIYEMPTVRGTLAFLRFLSRLIEITCSPHPFVLLLYPDIPFLNTVTHGSARSTKLREQRLALVQLSAYLALIKLMCHMTRKKLIVDVSDVPSFESDGADRNRDLDRALVEQYEKKLLDAVDVIWTVSPPQGIRLAETYDVPISKFITAVNGSCEFKRQPRKGNSNTIRFVIAGTLSRNQDTIKDIVAAFAKLPQNCELYLLGGGGDWVRDLLDERMYYLGVLPNQPCMEFTSTCDVGIVTYFPDDPYYLMAHPVRLGCNIAAGLAILSGNIPYLDNYLREHEIGITMSRTTMSEAFAHIAANPILVAKWKRNALAMNRDVLWSSIFARAFEQTRKLCGK